MAYTTNTSLAAEFEDNEPVNTSVITGDRIQTGKIQSNNWTTNAGSEIDLNAATIKLGGSTSPDFSVTYDDIAECDEDIPAEYLPEDCDV